MPRHRTEWCGIVRSGAWNRDGAKKEHMFARLLRSHRATVVVCLPHWRKTPSRPGGVVYSFGHSCFCYELGLRKVWLLWCALSPAQHFSSKPCGDVAAPTYAGQSTPF
eukprot:gene18188-biopygen17382